MTAATSTPAAAVSARPTPPPGLRVQLDPTMAGTGAVDGGWWPRSRDPQADTIGVTRAGQTRVILLVVPPQAPPAAAGVAMAMAADAATSAGPADILAAAGIGEDPAPISPEPRPTQKEW